MGIKKIKLAIFISGRGSNMLSIIDACKSPDFPAEISVVLSNNPDAQGLISAQKCNIDTKIIGHQKYNSRKEFEDAISERLKNYDIDLIVLAGFMRILTANFTDKWDGKIINIHPSLLPEYKGLNTHERAINDGKTESGCTVHFVSAELDSGSIIMQARVPILEDDTPDKLAARILEQEHKIYPEAIRQISSSIL